MPGWSWDSSACRRKPTRSPPSPELLDTLDAAGQLTGALVTIDAMGCQVDIAQKINDAKAHYVLALKGNQPTLEADVTAYFETAPAEEIVATTTVEKDHGRIETRCYRASANVDWIASERSYPGQPRFPAIKTLIEVRSITEQAGRISRETRTYISNAPLDIERLAAAIRGHWGVESMHWLLDVEFKDDLSRYRQGYGAKNMAVVRRFALDLVRAHGKVKGSVKRRRKRASWDPEFLARCFESFVAAMWPQRHDVIAIDDKTARRTHDKRKGLKALHTLSAYATNARLVLGQLSVQIGRAHV